MTPFGEFDDARAAWLALLQGEAATRITRDGGSDYDECLAWLEEHCPDAEPTLAEALGIAPEDTSNDPRFVEDVS